MAIWGKNSMACMNSEWARDCSRIIPGFVLLACYLNIHGKQTADVVSFTFLSPLTKYICELF